MATLRDELLEVFDFGRTLIDELGFRQPRVIIYSTAWSGGSIGAGTPTITQLELVPRPKVVESDGGQRKLVGPITPQWANGGYTPLQLAPMHAAGVESFVRVIEPDATTDYVYGSNDVNGPNGYYLRLQVADRPLAVVDPT